MRRRGAAAAPVVGAVKKLSLSIVGGHGSASLDDLRAESGADELFSDEACTQLCTAADLVHGAIVYARHNAAEEEEGDAMADEEEG